MMDTRMLLLGLLYVVVIASVALLAWQEGHHTGMQNMCDEQLVQYHNGSIGCGQIESSTQYPEPMREIAEQEVEGIHHD